MKKAGLDDEILELLRESKNKYVSGEVLSKKFKITRTAIWKHLNTLRGAGYDIESHTHLGYMLKGVPDLLLPAEISKGLKTRFVGQELYCLNEIGSTNDFAVGLAEHGSKEGVVVIAEKQTKGKGRLGRKWVSPKGAGLWFSLILRPKLNPYHSSKITFIAGLAVLDAVSKLGVNASLKWPNDVLVGKKKLCGILTELKAESDIISHLVIGIGLNVNFEKADFPVELKTIATSMYIETGNKSARIKILQDILLNIENYYEQFKEDGFEPILRKWKQYSATIGNRVKIKTDLGVTEGFAQDIDDDCALIVRLDSGKIERVVTGDVS